jgi:hypothetical protein
MITSILYKCSKCKQDKLEYEFHKNKAHKNGLENWCKNCVQEQGAIKRKLNPKNHREHTWKAKGIKNPDGSQFKYSDYENMYELQEGKCGICGIYTDNVVLDADHNHKTGVIRGLLHQNCNNGLGCFKDSLELLEKAKQYLNKE